MPPGYHPLDSETGGWLLTEEHIVQTSFVVQFVIESLRLSSN